MVDFSTAFSVLAAPIATVASVFGIVRVLTELRGGSRKSIRDEYEFQNKLQKAWDTDEEIHPAVRDLALFAFAGRKDVAPEQIAYFIRRPSELRTYLALRSRLAPIDESRRVAFKPKWESQFKRKRQKVMCLVFLGGSLLFPLIPFLAPFTSAPDRALQVALTIAYTLALDWWMLHEYTLTTRAEALVERQPLLSTSSVPLIDPNGARNSAETAATIEAAKSTPAERADQT